LSDDLEFVEWYKKIQLLLNQDLSKINEFHEILKLIIKISEELYTNIWSGSGNNSISEFFIELLALNWQVKLTSLNYFPEILRSLSSGGRFSSKGNEDAKIIICSPEEAILLRFDLVILTNFSENIWPTSQPKNPWFNQQMQNRLGLYSEATKWGLSLYNFYLLIHNPKIILTRSRKQDGKSELLPSSYLQRLKFALKNDDFLFNKLENDNKEINISTTNNHLIATSNFFPSRISVTDVEMLMRNPYGFYAKKILKLRKQEDIITPPTLAEFGSFIHKVIEEYTREYNCEGQKASNMLKDILSISANILSNTTLPSITKKIWQNKFVAIAKDFIEFDIERRSEVEKIYTEIKGEMSLQAGEQKITITAIADRIEIDREGRAIILDYKTGTLSSTNDVLKGLSPQLMLEAIIAKAGGFNIFAKDVSKLLYVKIASSKPYIKVNEIEINTNDLEQHFMGLQKLLTRYVTDKNFCSQVDLSKYNDYKYLTRN
jgi:ATP-dependent helicase/nuclease subunit B